MTNQDLWYRIAGREPDIRAADADRERIAERLRRAHAEGRLDLTEFQERLERCYEAKMLGELAELVRDLPRADEHADRAALGWLVPWRLAFAPLALILIILSIASAGHGHHLFWLWIPLVFLVWRMSWWRRRRSLASSRRGWDGWI